MLVLGLETSCDETAAAVLKDGDTLLSNVIHENGIEPDIIIERKTPEELEEDDEKEKEPEEKTRLRRFLREKDLKKHLKGKSSIGNVNEENKEESTIKKEETEEASINEDLVKDNQLQHAVSLLSSWEVMKKVFKNLQVPIPESDSRISMH